MLLQTTVSPNLLSIIPTDPLSQKLFCNLWLGVLYDFVESCILILPNSHVTEAEYLSAIGIWPAKYRKRGLELINTLKQRHRFIKTQINYNPTNCTDAVCQNFTATAVVNTEAFHLFDQKCASCPNLSALSPRAVEALEYFVSEFSRVRREKISQVLWDGQWNQKDFEREVLKPVFACAKHIKIFDRWIGRSAFEKKNGTVQFNSNYRRTIEWIASLFVALGGLGRGGVFEIYCGIEGHILNAAQRVKLKAEMTKFELSIHAKTGLSIKVVLKEETKKDRCPHGRYLVTDQLAVLIDRGFDLLWDDNKMIAANMNPSTDPRPIRDLAVTLCNDCTSVETQTKKLPPL